MRIVTARRVSQIFFLALFLWFCITATVGEKLWQLRGWPVNWILQLDPLVALGTILTTRTLYAGLLWALVTVALTLLLGRFFCGWLCPFGSIHQFFGWLGRRGKGVAAKARANTYRPAQAIKYYILAFLLAGAGCSLLAELVRPAPTTHRLAWALLALAALALAWTAPRQRARDRRAALRQLALFAMAWALLALLMPGRNAVAASLQTGLLDPIPLLHRSVNLVLLPLFDHARQLLSVEPRFYQGAWIIGLVFAAAVALNLAVPRFYCRFVCPLGALFGVLARWAPWRIGRTEGAHCTHCKRCDTDCEGACDPDNAIRISECLLCMNCLVECKDRVIAYQTSRSAAGEITGPDITRRGLLVSLASGLLAVPIVRLGAQLAGNWNPRLIRPPGALAEAEFAARCIKCGQCMRVCPTNVIQPAVLEAGIEGLWTPTLNYRIGTSGCQLNCVACGHVCPTAAIRPLALDEKLGRGAFADAGPIRMGTAFFDHGRCLPWAMDKPCIVCQENCPVSPKAIYVREHYQTLRDGELRVRRAAGAELELEPAVMRPGAFASGDYFCLVRGADAPQLRRIAENTASTITIDAATPWAQAPAPGATAEIQVRLLRPYLDLEFCIGCGVCEHECPVIGLKAVRVTAENESRSADRSLLL